MVIKAATPRTTEQATTMLELVARLHGQVAAGRTQRDEAIATINGAADLAIAPVLEELAACNTALQAWWTKAGHQLLTGKRKTLVLGGCKVGTKAAPLALTFGNSDDFEVGLAKLRDQRWAKPYVRVSYSVDKTATKEALDGKHGKHGEQLRELGFGTRGGADVFVLEAVQQAGTIEAR